MDLAYAEPFSIQEIQWAGFSVATALSTLRYHLQRSSHGALQIDDWIHIAALVQCLAYVVSTGISNTYNAVAPQGNINPDSPAAYLYWVMEPIRFCLFFGTIFTSKAVFFALYKKVFGVSRSFMYWWYISAVITLFAFLVLVIFQFTLCGTWPVDFNFQTCGHGTYDDNDSNWQIWRVSILSISLNVSTDIILILLPLSMVFKTQKSRSWKMKVMPIFLLTLVTIFFDIVSWTFDALNESLGLPGYVVAGIFLALEPIMAIIVSALPAIVFRSGKERQRSAEDMIEQGDKHTRSRPNIQAPKSTIPVRQLVTESGLESKVNEDEFSLPSSISQ